MPKPFRSRFDRQDPFDRYNEVVSDQKKNRNVLAAAYGREEAAGDIREEVRAHECEECGHVYGYRLTGAWTVDVVPCPRCGRVQRQMIPLARRLYRRWFIPVGITLACLPLLFGPAGVLALLAAL